MTFDAKPAGPSARNFSGANSTPAQNQPGTILESQPDSEISADQVNIDLTDADDETHRSFNITALQSHEELVQAASAGKALAAATGGKRTPEKNQGSSEETKNPFNPDDQSEDGDCDVDDLNFASSGAKRQAHSSPLQDGASNPVKMRADINDRFGNSPIEKQSSRQPQLSPDL